MWRNVANSKYPSENFKKNIQESKYLHTKRMKLSDSPDREIHAKGAWIHQNQTKIDTVYVELERHKMDKPEQGLSSTHPGANSPTSSQPHREKGQSCTLHRNYLLVPQKLQPGTPNRSIYPSNRGKKQQPEP